MHIPFRSMTGLFSLLAAGGLVADGSAAAEAQTIPTNLAGHFSFPDMPAGFNALAASQAELAAYGLPPRPDAATAPEEYATWARAMAASHQHLTHPLLVQSTRRHGPATPQRVKAVPLAAAAASPTLKTYTSQDWSGYALTNAAVAWGGTSFAHVNAQWAVPNGGQPNGECVGPLESSTLVGLDGFGPSDVLEAGTDSDSDCTAVGQNQWGFDAWYEWYPAAAVVVSNLPVSGGDDMFVMVWATSATQGHAYILDYNLGQYVTVAFAAPSGTKLVGQSAEWILQASGATNTGSNLANYGTEFFAPLSATTLAGAKYNLLSPGVTVDQFTMVGPNNNTISVPTRYGAQSFTTYVTGTPVTGTTAQ